MFRSCLNHCSGLTIPNVHTQLDDKGELIGERAASIEKNLTLMLDDLDFMVNAIVNQRALQ